MIYTILHIIHYIMLYNTMRHPVRGGDGPSVLRGGHRVVRGGRGIPVCHSYAMICCMLLLIFFNRAWHTFGTARGPESGLRIHPADSNDSTNDKLIMIMIITIITIITIIMIEIVKVKGCLPANRSWCPLPNIVSFAFVSMSAIIIAIVLFIIAIIIAIEL